MEQNQKSGVDNTLQNVGILMFFTGILIIFFAPIYKRTESTAVKVLGFIVSLVLECCTFYMIYAYLEFYKKTGKWGDPAITTLFFLFLGIYILILGTLIANHRKELGEEREMFKRFDWKDALHKRFEKVAKDINKRTFILEHSKQVDQELKLGKVDLFLLNNNKDVEC